MDEIQKLLTEYRKTAAQNYMEVGDRVQFVDRGIMAVIVEKKFGNKYYNFKATDDDGKIWWMRTRSDQYKENRSYKFLNRVNKNTFEKKQKPHIEQREKDRENRSKGYDTATKHNLQPGDMVIVKWRTGNDLAQVISVDFRGARAQIYNSNFVVQSIPLHLIVGKDKKAKPWKKVFELENKLREKQERRQRRRRSPFGGIW